MIYHGPLWGGSTALHRCNAFKELLGDTVIASDNQDRVRRVTGLSRVWRSVRWRLGYPQDTNRTVEQLRAQIAQFRPDVVFVDSSQYISGRTLRSMRAQHDAIYVYYTPDDIIARHNRSRGVVTSFPEWDLFFTTKTFNLSELRDYRVRRPELVGIAFDPALHRPLTPEAVGPDFERYDCVFMGAPETPRLTAVNALAEAGCSIVVFSNDWPARATHPAVDIRPATFDEGFVQGMHTGKLALNFLRKINRDQITTRSVEIPAMGRVMLSEKTEEHDQYFIDGSEYIGFRDTMEIVAKAKALLANPFQRASIAAAGRIRCLTSGYSTRDRARGMLDSIASALANRSHQVASAIMPQSQNGYSAVFLDLKKP